MATFRDISEMVNFIREMKTATIRGAAIGQLEATVKAEGFAKKNAQQNFKGTRERPKTGNLMNSIFSGFDRSSGKQFPQGFVGVRSQKGNRGTRPYGRIHEFGGTIKPRKAKFLWIPMVGPKTRGPSGKYRNWTPRDFVRAMKSGEGSFFIRKGMAMVSETAGPKSRKPRAKPSGAGTKKKASLKDTASKSRAAGRLAGKRPKVGGTTSNTSRKGRDKLKVKTFVLFLLRSQVVLPERAYVRPAVAKAFEQMPDIMRRRIREQVRQEAKK